MGRKKPQPAKGSPTPSPPAPGLHAFIERFAFPLLAGAVGLLAAWLAWFTWAKWGDAVIDVGREMEIPWKILEGGTLYKDLAYNYGPFSPYLNALFLAVFGVRLGSLVLAGFLAAGIGALLVYLVARKFLGRAGSMAMVAVFLLECAFPHTYANGSFNFILPYAYPAVHSVLFAFGALLLFHRYVTRGGVLSLAGAGALTGATLLCKIEIAGALAAALAAAVLLHAIRSRAGISRTIRDALAWGIPFAAVAAIGFLPFLLASSWERVVGENVFKSSLVDVRSNVFFLRQLGFENLGTSLVDLVLSSLFWGVGAAALLWAAGRIGTGRGGSGAPLGLIVAAAVLVASWFALPYETVYRVLPLAALTVAAIAAWRLLKRPTGDVADHGADLFAFALGGFAFLAVLRIVLNVGTYQYGFFMALPGLVLLGTFLASILPRWLGSPGKRRRPYAVLVLALLVVQAARNFTEESAPMYRNKTLEISAERGTMHAHRRPRYEAIQIAVEHLEKHHPDPGETLLVIPEGVSLNFLTGRSNPTSFNLLIPPELNAPGVEERLIAEIEEHRIDTILLIDRQVREYGFQGPGIDYAEDLMRYVRNHYKVTAKIGPEPYSIQPKEGGALLFRRKEPGP